MNIIWIIFINIRKEKFKNYLFEIEKSVVENVMLGLIYSIWFFLVFLSNEYNWEMKPELGWTWDLLDLRKSNANLVLYPIYLIKYPINIAGLLDIPNLQWIKFFDFFFLLIQ